MKMVEFPSRKESFLSRRGWRELAWMLPLIIVLSLAISALSARYQMWALAPTLVVAVGLLLTYGFFKGGKLSFQRIVIFLLVASILSPSIRLPAGIPDVRLELIIVLIAWGLLLLGYLATNYSIKLRPNPAYKWFTLFGLVILFSMIYAALVKGYAPIGRDFWELGKLLEYFLIFALVANLRISSIDMKRYYKIALLVFLCSALFGFAQYLNLGNINAMVSPYYYAPTQMQRILSAGRITGTTGNPNEFGALMVLSSTIALSAALFFREKKLRLFSWACLAVFGLAIVFTLSRSALIALAVAVGFILLFKYPLTVGVRRSIRRLFVVIPLVIVIGLVIIQLAPSRFFLRTMELGNIASATNWQGRLIKWQNNLELWKESPLFGWGPGKATMITIVDNEWLLLLRRYGVIGILIFLSWFTSFYFGLSRIRRGSSVSETTVLTVALQATLVAYAVYMIPAAVYHLLQLMPILLLFLGLAYSQSRAKSPVATGGSRS